MDIVLQCLNYSDQIPQMMIANQTDRFSIAIHAIRGGAKVNNKVAAHAHETCSYLRHLMQKEREYILENGKGTFVFSKISFQLCSLELMVDFLFIDHDHLFDTPKFD